MADAAMNGKGFLFSHSNAGWFAYQTGINWDGIERAVLDTTHTATPVYSGTTAIRTKEPGDLVDIGTLRATLFWAQTLPPLFDIPEICTLVGPTPRGKSKGAILTDKMFIQACSVAIQIADLMSADCTIQLCGTNFSFTPSA